MLLAYIVEPFLLRNGETMSQNHTHHLESVAIAESFLALGYDVDVIDYRNAAFQPNRNYSFFVSARTNFVKISERLNKDCIKIAHLDTAHFLFNNAAAFGRLLEMQERRKASAWSLKVIEKNWAPEYADYCAVLGNQFTLDTYRYAGKKMFRLPVPTPIAYPSPEKKNVDSVRKNFLWFGSGGLVHKGLDLTLEAFSRLPDFHLTVCGPIESLSEREFRQAYIKELYETDNIDTIGWVDVSSTKFLDIMSNCIGLVYPSCSEGQSGAVITCMRAGLIPIISIESGVDVQDFGTLLKDCSVDEIVRSVSKLASASPSELLKRAIRTWQYAGQHHTQSRYSKRYQEMIKTIRADALN